MWQLRDLGDPRGAPPSSSVGAVAELFGGDVGRGGERTPPEIQSWGPQEPLAYVEERFMPAENVLVLLGLCFVGAQFSVSEETEPTLVE